MRCLPQQHRPQGRRRRLVVGGRLALQGVHPRVAIAVLERPHVTMQLCTHVVRHRLNRRFHGKRHCLQSIGFSHTKLNPMNLVWCSTVALALATLVHLKLQYDRDNAPDTVYLRREALNEGVLRLHVP